jgi:hypothetical protein
MKIWTCGSYPRCGAFLWVTFRIFSSRSIWFPLAIVDHGWNVVTSLWHRDKATINGVVAEGLNPPQKNRSVKIDWRNSHLNFLELRQHSDHWLSSKGPNYQRLVLLNSAGAAEGHFEGKTSKEVHQGCLVLAWQCPSSLGICNTEETGLPGLQCLDNPPHPPDLSPSDYHKFPVLKKTIQSSTIFIWCGGLCCHGDPVGRITIWVFFSVLQNLQQWAKKCIELYGEYAE